jgi:hypothetical protein
MNAKKYHRITQSYPFPDYEEWAYLRDNSTRMAAINESWDKFKEKRPFCAKLLVALFGKNHAKEAHLNISPFSETKALLALNELESGAILPDNSHTRTIIPCKRDS